MSPAEAAAGPMVPASFEVVNRRRETADTWTLDLRPRHDGVLGTFAPGQFAMLYAFGAGEVPISISGDLTAAGPLVHTIRAVGATTSALCGMDVGSHVGVRGPFGTAWPVAEAEGHDVVVVAGGIGLAPLRPVIYHLLAHRERYGSVAILVGGRSPAELLFTDELRQWRARFDVQVEVTVDSATPDWRGRVGVVTKLIPKAMFDPEDAVAMVCGPEVMMRFTASELELRGMARERIHVSMERSMHCAVGFCGHCQLREFFVCKDGPVFTYDRVETHLRAREL
jgi:NAD(P)H-flavin reductase